MYVNIRRFLRNLWWFGFFLLHFGKVIPMSLSKEQLDLLQADLDAAKEAAIADDNALAQVEACCTAADNAEVDLTNSQTFRVGTAAAVDAADAKLLADVTAMATPVAPVLPPDSPPVV